MTVLLAGLVVCTAAAVAYVIARLVVWAGHALPDLYDTEPQPNDTSETGGTR